MSTPPLIGVFGGSGFYSFLERTEEIVVDTPFGPPSAPVVTGDIGNRRVAFLPRHGARHEFPPHRIPYRANLWAFKELGVQRVLAPTAAGSLQPHVRRGDFVISDQVVDRTSGRASTFYDGPETVHVSLADPYCEDMRVVAVKQARAHGISVHETGTVVVIEGPRFSTRAESRWYSQMGWEVINMTQYPEVALARELELCYCNISLITDYDCGVEGTAPVTVPEVIKVFNDNNAKLRDLLLAVIPELPEQRTCPCATALAGARVGGH
ncbi:MAG TPA: S-methyl-5'-thioadenosine phosphorylase [Actinomycetota bacterium]|nr:S-methyl-5'-thioadenosine phosphorylase [Actinomycetota bacterium]